MVCGNCKQSFEGDKCRCGWRPKSTTGKSKNLCGYFSCFELGVTSDSVAGGAFFCSEHSPFNHLQRSATEEEHRAGVQAMRDIISGQGRLNV